HVNVGDQTLTNHAQGIADAVLRINDEFVREDVQDFAVFRERNVACGVDGAAHIFPFDVARALTQGDPAAAVYAANVVSGDADERFFDGNEIGRASCRERV